MATLYLTEQGSTLRKTGERMVVEKDDEVLLDVQCHKLDSVLVFGNVQITTQALTELLSHGIDFAFLTKNGKLKGRLTPIKSKNIELRMAQYERSKDYNFTLSVSSAIVRGKIRNGLEVLRRFSYNHKDIDLRFEMERLEEYLEEVENKQTIESLVGLEGIASKDYFSAFAKMILGKFEFPGRRRRPATDPVNALLSFGYVLITNKLHSLLEATGFDPYIGFFHRIEYGRVSLALDLLEEFRHPLIDRFTLYLVNKKILEKKNFYLDEETGSMHLKEEAMKEYFKHFEKWMNDELVILPDNTKVTFKKCFQLQAQKMAKSVKTGEKYQPFHYER